MAKWIKINGSKGDKPFDVITSKTGMVSYAAGTVVKVPEAHVEKGVAAKAIEVLPDREGGYKTDADGFLIEEEKAPPATKAATATEATKK